MNAEHVAKRIISRLKDEGIDAYLWHKATTGSAYIRFKDHRIGSVRIADHDGKSKYKYKFNVRSDVKESYITKDNGVWRLFFPNTPKGINGLIHALVDRSERVKEWKDTKYQYGIPSFKRKERSSGKKG